jgi:hypothetical protein
MGRHMRIPSCYVYRKLKIPTEKQFEGPLSNVTDKTSCSSSGAPSTAIMNRDDIESQLSHTGFIFLADHYPASK